MGTTGHCDCEGNVWIDDGDEMRPAEGRAERLAAVQSFFGRKRQQTQKMVESVTDPVIKEVLESDLDRDEMEEYLGRPLTMAEAAYACRSKYRRHYAPWRG